MNWRMSYKACVINLRQTGMDGDRLDEMPNSLSHSADIIPEEGIC